MTSVTRNVAVNHGCKHEQTHLTLFAMTVPMRFCYDCRNIPKAPPGTMPYRASNQARQLAMMLHKNVNTQERSDCMRDASLYCSL